MGLGVLEGKEDVIQTWKIDCALTNYADRSGLEQVPGTVLLDEKAAQESQTKSANTQNLKHGTGKYSHIVLAPQPSDDPNDPLNFPKWKKEMIIGILTLGSMLNAGTNVCCMFGCGQWCPSVGATINNGMDVTLNAITQGPYLNASYESIAETLGLPLTTVVLVSGYNLLAAGLIGPWVAAFASKFGKRPVFLASTLICIVGTAIGEAKIDYNHLLAARIVQGFATSAFESLIVASVGDLYFLHERGKRVAFINFILNACSGLASIICGQVFASLGWLWLFHLFQIFLVVQFIAMYLFCPETTYIREARPANRAQMGRVHTNFSLKSLSDDKKRLSRAAAPISGWYEDDSSSEIDIGAPVNTPKKKTFLQSLAVFTGVYSQDNVFKFLFGPFLALACPGACYAILASGILTAWYVGSQIVLAGIFAAPPYLFGPSEVGFIGFGPFAGGLIAAIVMAIINEPVVQWMVRKNGGV